MYENKFVIPGMVLTSDGNSKHVAHKYREISLFGEEKKLFVTALDLTT